jgi:hypothetical protein
MMVLINRKQMVLLSQVVTEQMVWPSTQYLMADGTTSTSSGGGTFVSASGLNTMHNLMIIAYLVLMLVSFDKQQRI